MTPEGTNNMNNKPETEFDLEKMFLPEWAVKPPTPAQYTEYTAEEEKKRGRKGEFPRRRERERQPRAAERERGGRAEERRERRRKRERRERIPLPRVKVNIILDDNTVDAIVRQIKRIGRAFPLFELARKALDYPDRQLVKFEVIKKQDGTPVQPLYLCLLDNTLWLSEMEAIDYVLDKHFSTFYQAERTQIEPPKGKYTFVAQCGLSGVILGPPNHHDYQLKLRKLHAERFSHIPFDEYKKKIKIVRDEEIVKKWIEEQSWRTEYITLNVPEPIRLLTREEVVQHFKQTHLPTIIQQVDSYEMPGPASRNIPCVPLQRLVRRHWQEQRRFPMKLAVFLSQKFAEQGLQFFKWDRRITYVAISRPRYLDLEESPVSENVRKIIEFIKNHPGCTRHDVIEALAPSPQKININVPEEKPSETQPTAVTETAPVESGQAAETAPAVPAQTELAQAAQSQSQPVEEEFTPEQLAVIADIHWLVHQGHIIEFYNGKMYVAKKPAPKPQKEPKPAPQAQGTEAQASQQPAGQAATAVSSDAEAKAEVAADKDVAEPVDVEQLQKDSFEGEEPLPEDESAHLMSEVDEDEDEQPADEATAQAESQPATPPTENKGKPEGQQ
jgi:uncharacterized membrane protein